ncbi:hypothetical protein CN918_29260 [Priestia megaterium]|nr:hypothetical protein CN918_29260 [Priestia megaterium]
MRQTPEDGGIIRYIDDEGNELRVWAEDKRVIGADFRGVEYAVSGAGVHTNYWSKVGTSGRVSKDFRDWFEQVERTLGHNIKTNNLSRY